MKLPAFSQMTSLLSSLILMSVFSMSAMGQSQPAPAPGAGGAAAAPAEPTEAEIEAQQKKLIDKIETFGWTRSGKSALGSMAEVSIPQGWRFTGPQGTRDMLKLFDNVPGTSELGMMTTEGLGPWVIFEFENTGYVKDDEKSQLDAGADEMLKTFQEGQEAANVERKRMGLGTLKVVGWALPPRFNDQTKNLEWALRVVSESGNESINYNTRLLGRHGVMEVELVCDPEEMQTLLPQYQGIMKDFQYTTGNTYAEFRAGDKVAEYGLTALIAGGGAVAAAKMGLFAKLGGLVAKLGKGIVVVVVAIGAGIKALFSKLFGRKESV
ncbi:DUF2167 domain-containing protein [Brevifollis gellanilyticus]|uniref:Membrane protein n=1 Tax=Brevifollis gellanilyticus TaxID=748831 RepID=A0A512M9N0_9BACT|nr:DUF2167 domain-containing protein [Brevifollis gellanilyticus]GEP43448.1 membrane protein [Brevifollis gellanilyticus]